MLTRLLKLSLGTLFFLTLGACAEKAATAPLTIAEITANTAAYVGKTVLLSGEYRDWEAGHGSPPVTRSDWILKDGTAAIYVTGKIPSGLDPQKDMGKKVTVQGIVKVKDGRVYIEAGTIK